MRIITGTSGFAYKEWKGGFYPAELPASGMLRYYAERLNGVEINNTFYRMPRPDVLAQWAADVPADFTFVLKASQQITHRKRLKDVGEPVSYFLRTAAVLGDRLGPTLVQLPPNMKKDVARLDAFLDVVPPGARIAVEFRHASWFDDDVYASLHAHAAALCLAEADDLVTPRIATASWGYLRLRRVVYDEPALDDWAGWARAQAWSDTFTFFKHEDAGTGPRLAARFADLLREQAGNR